MLNFAKRFTTIAFRCVALPYKFQSVSYFCNQKQVNAVFAKLKETYLQKGKDSQQYQQQMARAMREALGKHDDEGAIDLQLHHLSLIKETDGEKSEFYRTELRQITKFCMNRQFYDTASELIQQLRNIEQSMRDISPLDLIATYYLQGTILSELGKNEQSKALLRTCVQRKEVQQTPQVYFKIYAELARVHAKCGQKQETYDKIKKCQEIINKRAYNPDAPPMVLVMDLLDIFQLAELASNINDKNLTQKYINLYKERLDKVSNQKDPMYVEYLERKARLHFNLKQFSKTVELLRQAIKLSQQLGKVDPNFIENAKIMSNIAQSVQNQYLKK